MGTRKTNVPAIPDVKVGDAASVARAAAASKEAIEVGLGRRGDPLDRFLTVRDLKEAGIIAASGDGRGGVAVTGPGDNGAGPGDGAPIFDPEAPDYGENDFTVPPAPRNVGGRGVPPNSIMVTWDPPNYGNHRKAEVFCLLEGDDGSPPTMDDLMADLASAKVGEADGTIFMHADLVNVQRPGENPLDAALTPSVRYYWVRFVSMANVRGPLAPLDGAAIAMALDPVAVLDAMIGNVTLSPIYANLRGWFGSMPGDPILAAGGIRRYINQQDGLIIGELDTLEAVVGTNQPGDPNLSLFQWVRQVQAQATANSAQLTDITTWQAALSMAANGNEPPQYYSVTGYDGMYVDDVSFDVWVAPGTPIFAAGSRFSVSAPDGGILSPINGRTFDIHLAVSISQTVQRLFTRRSASSTSFPATVLYDFTGPNANTRVMYVDPAQVDFIDFIATVQRNIFVAVDANTAIGRELGIVRAMIGDPVAGGGVWGETQQINQAVARLDGTVENLWSVRMRQDTGNGLIYSAGFGLGMTSDNAGNSVSTFLVNANQFAVMGPTGPGVLVRGYERIAANRARFVVVSAAHGLEPDPGTGTPPASSRVTITIPDGNSIQVPAGDGSGDPIESGNPLASLRGVEMIVREAGGGTGWDNDYWPWVILEIPSGVPATMPNLQATTQYMNWQSPSWDPLRVQRINYALLPPNNIPFIVDTTRNVIGIRGSLIVNGLIAADAGQFTSLTANTAFIRQLQAEVVNANVVIGQRLIAGTPGTGALTAGSYDAISNFIVEMNNPVTNQYPLRLWKPSTQQMAFGLTRMGDLLVGGNMSVGGNAVIATTDYTTTQPSNATLFSVGGQGGDGDKYALWIGPRGQYGTAGELRRETSGLFWVKENGRAGFNSDLFLGSGALALPSVAAQTEANPNPGTTYSMPTSSTIRADALVQVATSVNTIRIRADREGRAAPTVVTVSGLLVAAGTPGGGNDKFFKVRAELVGSANGTPVTGGLVQEFIQDDYSPECHPFTMTNIVQVPAGNYFVRITVETIASTKPMSIIRGWNVVAMQVGA